MLKVTHHLPPRVFLLSSSYLVSCILSASTSRESAGLAWLKLLSCLTLTTIQDTQNCLGSHWSPLQLTTRHRPAVLSSVPPSAYSYCSYTCHMSNWLVEKLRETKSVCAWLKKHRLSTGPQILAESSPGSSAPAQQPSSTWTRSFPANTRCTAGTTASSTANDGKSKFRVTDTTTPSRCRSHIPHSAPWNHRRRLDPIVALHPQQRCCRPVTKSITSTTTTHPTGRVALPDASSHAGTAMPKGKLKSKYQKNALATKRAQQGITSTLHL